LSRATITNKFIFIFLDKEATVMLGLGQIIQTPLDNKQKPQHVVVQHLDQTSEVRFFSPQGSKARLQTDKITGENNNLRF
jgi:hypothetical protein